MAGDEFRVGDVVRVTLEGKVTRVLPALGGNGAVELRVEPEEGCSQYVTTDQANVEKVEPKEWGVGDTVRHYGGNGTYSIGQAGYYHHESGIWVEGKGLFDAAGYERVEVG